jgi:uncharacterized membrane protein YkoI
MIKARLSAILFVCLLALAAVEARADDEDVMDRLRAAVSRGEALPLSTLQRSLRKAFPGEIIGVEVDEDDGRFVYEFKVLQTGGRLLEVKMDAATGAVLDVEND